MPELVSFQVGFYSCPVAQKNRQWDQDPLEHPTSRSGSIQWGWWGLWDCPGLRQHGTWLSGRVQGSRPRLIGCLGSPFSPTPKWVRARRISQSTAASSSWSNSSCTTELEDSSDTALQLLLDFPIDSDMSFLEGDPDPRGNVFVGIVGKIGCSRLLDI